MKHSEQIDKIFPAFIKMQGELKPAVFNKTNPHFKTKFADLVACKEACKEVLTKNELGYLQTTISEDGRLLLETRLIHTSGQWIATSIPLSPKAMDSQSIGAAYTYMKRYGLSAALGLVADEDDDSESEMDRPAANKTTNKTVALDPIKKLRDEVSGLRARLTWANKTAFDKMLKEKQVTLETASEAQLGEFKDRINVELKKELEAKRNVA